MMLAYEALAHLRFEAFLSWLQFHNESLPGELWKHLITTIELLRMDVTPNTALNEFESLITQYFQPKM